MRLNGTKRRILAALVSAVLLASEVLPLGVGAAADTMFSAIDGTAGNSGESYDKLFDGNNSGSSATKWCVQNHTAGTYVVIKAKELVTVTKYTLITGNDTASHSGRNPKAWTLSGSNDYNESSKTGTWTVIDTVTDGGMLAANHTSKSFTVSGAAAYRYYKFNITAIASTENNKLMQIAGIAFTYTTASAGGGGGSGGTPAATIDVSLSWDEMSFTYGAEWDPATHSHGGNSWSPSAGTVTVKNNGSDTVEAQFTYTASGNTGVTGTLTKQLVKLAAGASDSTAFSLSGAPTAELNKTTLGTLAVSLRKFTTSWSFSCAEASEAALVAALGEALSLGKTKLTLDMSGLSDDDTMLVYTVRDELNNSGLDNGSIELNLPGLKTVPGSAFQNCNALKVLSLPDAIKLENGIVEGCAGLEKIKLTASDTTFTVYEEAFYWNENSFILVLNSVWASVSGAVDTADNSWRVGGTDFRFSSIEFSD